MSKIRVDYQQGLTLIKDLKHTMVRQYRPWSKKWLRYHELYCGFDIETTNFGEKAYMWVWQFSIWDGIGDIIIVVGRRWEEFWQFIRGLNDILALRENTRLIVWDANFSFEFGFIQHFFNWDEIFAKERLKPLIARSGGLEFREVLSISQGNLEYTARTYCTTKKAVGDLDYTLIRNSKTDITDTEWGYIENDVIILAEWSKYIFDTYIKPQKYIPITGTGILRHELKQRAKASCNIDDLHKQIKLLYPETQNAYLYDMMYLFRGGYVHGRFDAMLETLYDMDSMDLKSSYPAQMLQKYYPVSPFEAINDYSDSNIKYNLANNCCILIVKLYHVKSTTNHSIESKSKCITLENPIIDNGRVRECDSMTVYLTELDYTTYTKFYTWDKMDILSFRVAKRGMLPRYLIDMVYELFAKKESIDKKADPQSYAIAKKAPNGMYGMTVTRLNFTDNLYTEGEWSEELTTTPYADMISKQVLSPYWGIYITAWGRYTIQTQLYDMRDEVVYNDTDSHKLKLTPHAKLYIQEYNDKIMSINKKVAETYGYDYEIIKKLGTLEWETAPSDHGIMRRFKGAGAKRYICEYANGEIESTIAGLGKHSLIKYADSINIDPFELFTDKMLIPTEFTTKLRPKYNQTPHDDMVTDYQGHCEKMHSDSSVALIEVDFTMSIDAIYHNLIDNYIRRESKTNGKIY